MSLEENKAIIRRVIEEVWNQGNLDVADEVYAANFVSTMIGGKSQTRTLESYKQGVSYWRTVFPDYHVTVEEQIAEGDKVMTRLTDRGTHQGELHGIAPTGKQVTSGGIYIHRIVDGKIVECWWIWESVGQKLGFFRIPTPPE